MDHYARREFRESIAPLLTDEEMEALARGLREDDPRIIQQVDTVPLLGSADSEYRCVEKACSIGYALWQGGGEPDRKVGSLARELTEFWCRVKNVASPDSGWAGANFVRWHDSEPWGEVRRDLLEEVERDLCRRQKESARSSGAV